MAKNDFKPFATASGANVISQADYESLTALATGFISGKASSAQVNKAIRQASFISAVLAQFIANNSEKDVVDDGDNDALLTCLEMALQEKINNTVPAASTTVAGITRLSSAIDSNDESIAATSKAVKAAYDRASQQSLDGIYPIGIVVWFAQNKDPNTLFPGTTWKYIGENKTVRLAAATGADVMTTGGSDAVTLTADNLPAHGHTFSANTSSFDYGTKATSNFDHGTKTTNNAGAHMHGGVPSRSNPWEIGGSTGQLFNFSFVANTDSAGDHAHVVGIGVHDHTVVLGEHSHAVEGTTANTGSGEAASVTNSFIKLMGWYRCA